MKNLKRIFRICGLIVFLMLAVAGMGILGTPPTLSKEGRLFGDNSGIPITKDDEKDNPDEDVFIF